MSDQEIPQEDASLNLKKFKRHERKFPWALVIRIVVALISIGMILYVSEVVLGSTKKENNTEFEIEIEEV